MVDAIVLEHKELLESFWAYLDRPAPPRRRVTDVESSKPSANHDGDEEDSVGLDPLQAQYFCKTISVFLTKRTSEVTTVFQPVHAYCCTSNQRYALPDPRVH